MVVYEEHNFAFLHINKTGGKTIKSLLEKFAGDPLRSNNQHLSIKLDLKRAHLNYPGVDMDKLNIYANVRNPFDRIVSMYAYRTSRQKKYIGMSFNDFFYNVYLDGNTVSGPIEDFLLIDGRVPSNVTVIRLEDINTEWPKIFKKHFGVTINSIPKVNGSRHLKAMNYFDDDMLRLVWDRESWVIKNYYPGI